LNQSLEKEQTPAQTVAHGRASPWPTWAVLAGWAVVALGVVLVVRVWQMQWTFFIDEILLLNNYIDRPFGRLHEPLSGYQAAPVGFSYAQKAIIETFGYGERAVRLLPMLCAAASLPVLLAVVRRLLSPLPGLVAMLLVSLSGVFIAYAAQNKQYTLEMLVGVVMLYLTVVLVQRPPDMRLLAAWTLAAVVAFWLSLTALVVVGGMGLVLLGWSLRAGRPRDVAAVVLAGVVSVTSFAVAYALTIRPTRQSADLMEFMTGFWDRYFLPLPLSRHAIQQWYAVLGGGVGDLTGMAVEGVGLLLLVVGAVYLVVRHRAAGWAVIVPLALLVLAAMLQQYPLYARLVLFVLPMVAIAIGAGLQMILSWQGWRGWTLAAATLALILPGVIAKEGYAGLTEDTRTVMKAMRPHVQPGDVIYVYSGAWSQWQHYQGRLGMLDLDGVTVLQGVAERHPWEAHVADFERVYGQPRAWVLLAHIKTFGGINEGVLLTRLGDLAGPRLRTIERSRSMAILYDFSDPDGAIRRSPAHAAPAEPTRTPHPSTPAP
jgi:hypothetical protein